MSGPVVVPHEHGYAGGSSPSMPEERAGGRGARLIAVPVAVAASALLGACGGSAVASSQARTTTPSATPPPPGASGQVAAISPTSSSMEVQNPVEGQVTVSWSSSTTFVRTVTASLSDVAVGDCVSITGAPATTGTPPGPITARTVTISAPSASGCSRLGPQGAGGSGIFRPPSGGTVRRGAGPGSGTGSGGPTAFVVGTVSSVNQSAGTFAVHGVVRTGVARRAGSSSITPSTTSTMAPGPAIDVTIDTIATTSYTRIEPASASDLAVGQCVVAAGPADQTGAITATRISIRPPSPTGTCFGPGRGRGGAPFGGGGGGTAGVAGA